MARFKLVLIVIGGMLCYFGYQEWRLASAASAEPHTISCAQLSKDGPGKNAHVTLTDFIVCEQSIVFESASKADMSTWRRIWVPAVPDDGEFAQTIKKMVEEGKGNDPIPTPNDIRVIIKSSEVHGKPDLDGLARRDKITGLITNTIESLGAEEKKHLQESYPGIDFDRCYILDHERKPSAGGKLAAMLGGGAILLLAGLGWLAAGMKK